MHSPLNYLGGKSRLAKKIVSMIPADHVCYCETFCGAAWVLYEKSPSKSEVINDLDGELVTLWRVLQCHLEEFLRYFKYAVTSRQIFELENKKDTSTLTDIQRAVRYFYLQRLGFGGKVSGRTFGTSATGPSRLNLTNIEERLLEVHWRLERVVIEHLDACACIERYDRPTTLFYVDPPYFGTAGYAVKFEEADYERLRATLAAIKGRFLLSLNEHPEVRRIFKQFNFTRVTTRYSTGSGIANAGMRKADQVEFVISNF